MRAAIQANPWRMGAVCAVAIFCILLGIKLSLPGGWTRLGGFGEHFSERYLEVVHEMGAYIKPDSGGYDGQFYAQLATDPTLQTSAFDQAMDEPSYRARRILLPWIAHALALGDPQRSIRIYCSLNVLCWFVFAALIWRWLEVRDARTFARWIACIFSMGVMDSVKYSLTDLPSILLILALIRYTTHRPLAGGVGVVASVFLKETNILAVTAMPEWKGNRGNVWRCALPWVLSTAVSITLFWLWYQYIHLRFEPFHGVRGNFDWPLVSMLRNFIAGLQELASGNWDDRYIFRTAAVIGFVIQGVYLLTRARDLHLPLVRLGWTFGALFLVLGDLVWWGYWAVCRVALPLTIAFNLLYAPTGKRAFWWGLALANLTVIHALYRFL